MKKLISPLDLSTGEIDEIIALADRIMENPTAFAHKCDGKILATPEGGRRHSGGGKRGLPAYQCG